MVDNKSILITGGTGSFGQVFIHHIFEQYNPKRVIIYSRDEYKQFIMRQHFMHHDTKIRYFIGDVRDKERLMRACDNVDFIVHAAALKQVPACEYNPFEAVKTNIHGAQNIVDVAINSGVECVVALSTDKAVNPINLYGATKLASDKLFVCANAYAGGKKTKFSVVRYGNVAGSRGSVIPFFRKLVQDGVSNLPITDNRMTRFWITLDEAVDLVFKALDVSNGGETYISKIPSFNITDLAQAMLPTGSTREIGIREGEKLHEVMITEYDSFRTREYDDHYIIYPSGFDWWTEDRVLPGGTPVKKFFEYSSGSNKTWLSVDEITELLKNINLSV